MKTFFNLLFISIGIFGINSCSPKPKDKLTTDNLKPLTRDSCPLSYQLEWRVVKKGVRLDKQSDLLLKLAAAAKADADSLAALLKSGSVNIDFESKLTLSKILQTNEVREAEVSQEVFDEYQKIRITSCNLWEAVTNGFYGKDEKAIEKARDVFTEIQKSFIAVEKKSLIPK